jgi:putative FmdB family regulatory protein
MPIYTYRCENCGVQFDQTQKFSDPQLTKCPECGKKTLQKVYTPVGIVFKGSGFYATDHRSPSGTSRIASEKKLEKAAESAESKTDAKSESKPEAAAPKESTTHAAEKTRE